MCQDVLDEVLNGCLLRPNHGQTEPIAVQLRRSLSETHIINCGCTQAHPPVLVHKTLTDDVRWVGVLADQSELREPRSGAAPHFEPRRLQVRVVLAPPEPRAVIRIGVTCIEERAQDASVPRRLRTRQPVFTGQSPRGHLIILAVHDEHIPTHATFFFVAAKKPAVFKVNVVPLRRGITGS